jgi:hypothetical protein
MDFHKAIAERHPAVYPSKTTPRLGLPEDQIPPQNVVNR